MILGGTGSSPAAHPTWYPGCMWKRVIVAIAVAGVAAIPTPAHAAKAPCDAPARWVSPFTQDEWSHTRCGGTMSVERGGGKLGSCTVSYPVGSRYSGPDSDCGYYANGGPI